MKQPFTLLTLGQVTHEADELPLPFLRDLANRKLHRECAAILSLADHHAPNADDPPFAGGEIIDPDSRHARDGKAWASAC